MISETNHGNTNGRAETPGPHPLSPYENAANRFPLLGEAKVAELSAQIQEARKAQNTLTVHTVVAGLSAIFHGNPNERLTLESF